MPKERWFAIHPDIHYEAGTFEEAKLINEQIQEAIHRILGQNRAWSVLGGNYPREVDDDE